MMSSDQHQIQKFKLNNSSSFNDLNSLSIYNKGNSHSSMSDIKNFKPFNSRSMKHAYTTHEDDNKAKKPHAQEMFRINTASNNFKEKKLVNAKHYSKVSEATLLDKSFSELIFEENKMMDMAEDQQTSPKRKNKETTYLYGTAKDHGFGTNDDNSIDGQNEEIQKYAPFGSKLTKETSRYSAKSQNNSVKNLKLDDPDEDDALAKPKLMDLNNDSNMVMKISQSNNLLNPIKEFIIKQINNETETSFEELDFYNGHKDLEHEDKEKDNFYKVENILNEEFINKKIILFLNELDESEIEYLKQEAKIKQLNNWKSQTHNKIKLIANTVESVFNEQINENMTEFQKMRQSMEKKFYNNFSKNEILTIYYHDIVVKYNQLVNVKLPNLEKWNESITKMTNYEKKTKATIINVYDISLLSILFILYVYYFYP